MRQFIQINAFIWCLLVLVGCQKASTPRPYGYFRIELPTAEYTAFDGGQGYRFERSVYATPQELKHDGEGQWMNLHYDLLNADIHCSYMPVRANLRDLTDDAMEFVYKHVNQASAIPEREFVNDKAKVYGVFFTLQGNTASPYQFFLTDSTKHFFRGAAYCNCRPNADSLQPVLEYLERDIEHLIESFEWR